MTDILDLTNQAMDDIPEAVVLDDGTEAELRIVNVTISNNKNGEPYILPMYDVPTSPDVDEFTHYMALPFDGMDPRKLIKAKRRIVEWATCFGIDLSEQLATDEMRGLLGWAILGVEKSEEYGDSNRVRRYVTGR